MSLCSHHLLALMLILVLLVIHVLQAHSIIVLALLHILVNVIEPKAPSSGKKLKYRIYSQTANYP